jgi:hypothetical protein
MRRYSFVGAITLALCVIASQMLGQDRHGPLGGAVQNAAQAAEGAEHHAAGAAGEAARRDSNIPSPRILPQPNTSADNAKVGAGVKPGSEARINVAPSPPVNPGVQADPRVSFNVTGDNRPDQWRYRWDNGRWWYWTPANRWMWYSPDGGWVNFDTAVPYSAGYGSYEVPSTGYYYYPSYGAYYYPGYGYRYPGNWYRGGYYYRPGISIGVGGIGIGVGGYGRYR